VATGLMKIGQAGVHDWFHFLFRPSSLSERKVLPLLTSQKPTFPNRVSQ
jgi:hypothetical protein